MLDSNALKARASLGTGWLQLTALVTVLALSLVSASFYLYLQNLHAKPYLARLHLSKSDKAIVIASLDSHSTFSFILKEREFNKEFSKHLDKIKTKKLVQLAARHSLMKASEKRLALLVDKEITAGDFLYFLKHVARAGIDKYSLLEGTK